MINLRCEHLFVWCNWLCVFCNVTYTFRVNPNSAWISRNSLLETGAISESQETGTGIEPNLNGYRKSKHVCDLTKKHAANCTIEINTHLIIWLIWLNGWVFVYELSDCGFHSRCSHWTVLYRACFKQGVSSYTGAYRVQFHCKRVCGMTKNTLCSAKHKKWNILEAKSVSVIVYWKLLYFCLIWTRVTFMFSWKCILEEWKVSCFLIVFNMFSPYRGNEEKLIMVASVCPVMKTFLFVNKWNSKLLLTLLLFRQCVLS